MNRLLNLWNRIFPIPRAKNEAVTQLAQAQLDLLEAHANAEYYSSLVYMLRDRVRRLEEAAK